MWLRAALVVPCDGSAVLASVALLRASACALFVVRRSTAPLWTSAVEVCAAVEEVQGGGKGVGGGVGVDRRGTMVRVQCDR